MGFLDKLKEKSGQTVDQVASLSSQIVQQATNIATSVAQTVTPTVSEEIRSKRYEICKSCPELLELTGQCKKCGCFMKVKTVIESAQCPLKKW